MKTTLRSAGLCACLALTPHAAHAQESATALAKQTQNRSRA